MKKMLLTAAGVAVFVLPLASAQAQSSTAGAFVGIPPAVTVHRGTGHGDFRRGFHRRDPRQTDGFVYWGDREYQGDTLWRSDSFNDWWHDRPDRSMPRWLANNENCQRLWWSGGNWRC